VTARLAVGGYQAVIGVTPDLTTLGKIIGGGLPVGAVGGRSDVMEIFSPLQTSFLAHAGTFNGNPLTMVAGSASLDQLPASEVERINRLGDILAEGLNRVIGTSGVHGAVTSCGSLVHVHFDSPVEIKSFRDVHLDSPFLVKLHLAALEEGLFFAPRGMLNTSTAMDERIVYDAIDRFGRALARALETAHGLVQAPA
jgi:glutamate-1-semialdehyde 2,1-aminomutase